MAGEGNASCFLEQGPVLAFSNAILMKSVGLSQLPDDPGLIAKVDKCIRRELPSPVRSDGSKLVTSMELNHCLEMFEFGQSLGFMLEKV